MADSPYVWDTENTAADEPIDALNTANDFLQSIEINSHTSLDQAILITILGLEIRNAHVLNELTRKVDKMTVDTSALDTAVQNAIALIEQLAANNNDAAVQAAVDADVAALNNSVAANTPAAPIEPPAV